jgi:hypothetical protein
MLCVGGGVNLATENRQMIGLSGHSRQVLLDRLESVENRLRYLRNIPGSVEDVRTRDKIADGEKVLKEIRAALAEDS